MALPDKAPPEDFPYRVDKNKLIDISDLHWYLHFRGMSDSRYESDHREVTWDSLGCSFQVARVFGKTVQASFREGPPSETEDSGLRDLSSEKEQRRQALYDYDPTYHLNSAALHSEIEIRVDENGGFSLDVPTAVVGVAIRTLAKTEMVREADNTDLAQIASILLEGFEKDGVAAFDYQRNPMRGGRLIQFFHEEKITEAIERRMTVHLVKVIGDRVKKIQNNGGDPSPLRKDLASLSEKISEAGLSEETAKVARDLADYVR